MGIDMVDPESYYRRFEEENEVDHEKHDKTVKRIDSILGSNNADAYEEIGRILKEKDAQWAEKLFNDLKDFLPTFEIYLTENHIGITPTIYDVVDSISDYSGLIRRLLYLFRRIQFLCGEEDILDVYREIRHRNLSAVFITEMLKTMNVGNVGFVGSYMASLFDADGRTRDSMLLEGLVNKIFGDIEPSTKSGELYTDKTYSKKVCFISCVNDDRVYEECLFYINRLIIPQGVTVDTICIKEADSMTSGYNAGMEASDADIKVYIHQDVCIINPFFLIDIIEIFEKDKNISMIGVVGSPKMPEDAVMWHGYRVGGIFSKNDIINYNSNTNSRYSGVEDVEAIDGLLMVTSKDVRWREDIFDGWDFYDVSECAEHRKKGYRIVVPIQSACWTIHDSYLLNLYRYGKYRKKYISEYMS